MSAPIEIRPVPIRDAFSSVTNATQFLGSLVTIVGGYGVLTAVQGNALLGLLGAVPGIAALVGDVWHAFKTNQAIHDAEAHVTPLESPVTVVEGKLVPLVPDPAVVPGQHRA
jgi:hypothetical protein